MQVKQMINNQGRAVANQFIITDNGSKFFQSYQSIIAKIPLSLYDEVEKIELDTVYWDYSRTTSKYRNMFLGETTKETKAKIASGGYILTNLN